MTKEARQFAAILKNWGPTLQRAVSKANANRYPSGAAGGKGGQFAPGSGDKGGGTAPFSTSNAGFKPKQLSLFNFAPKAPQLDAGSPKQDDYGAFGKPMGSWGSWGEPAAPKAPPPGAKPHPQVNDKGQPVTINYPTKPSAPETWKNPDATATFTPGSATPSALNGVPMKPWANAPQNLSEWANVEGQRPELDRDFPLDPSPGKSVGAGVIIQEPDGRIWLTKPTNHFGGYMQTFPKGTVEHGLNLQASAIKEAYEETGLKVQITGVLGDYERTTSVARFYIARRVGGTPADMGWESQALRLATSADLGKLLNMQVDKGILEDLRAEQFLKSAPLSLVRDHEVIELEVQRRGLEWLYKAGKPTSGKGGSWQHQERWPGGTPLGGQWKAMGADGLTLPPTIAGGLSGKNAAYQKKANAVHAMAQAGDVKGVVDQAVILTKKKQADDAAGKKSSHVKWNAQLAQYTTQLVSDITVKPKAIASADKINGPDKLSDYTYAGPKPGGSNPGAKYTDKDGAVWLVKGNAQIGTEQGLHSPQLMAQAASVNGAYTLKDSEDRAKNEVLASKLMAAAGIPGPEIKLVGLEGKHDGSDLGVAVKWVDGLQKFNPGNAAHVAAIQSQYAVHAWLGNYDVLGMGYDNTSIKDGKAINIDPGGALLFRAQGLKKPMLSASASEWETMRKTSAEQKSVFGTMTASQLQDSAKQLASISDDTINKLVDVYGPGDLKAKVELANTLRERRDNIMLKAGLTVNMKMGPSLAQAEPAPAPEPPKIADAVPAPANTATPTGIEKPNFATGMPSDAYYQGLADKALALHQAGDLEGLKAMATKKNGTPTWPPKTKYGKAMDAWHAALVGDLDGKHQTAIDQVADGKTTVTDAKGQQWQAEKGVLNPVAPAPAKKLTKDQVTAIADQFHPSPMSNAAFATSIFAMEGNAAKVKAFKPQTPSEKNLKNHLLAAMTGEAAVRAATAPQAAPASGSKLPRSLALGVISDHLPSYTTHEQAKNSTSSIGVMYNAALKGDLDTIKALKDADMGAVLAAIKADYITAMTPTAAPAPAAAKPLTFDHVKNLYLQSQMSHGVTAGGALENWKDALNMGSLSSTLAENAIKGDLSIVQQYPEDNTVTASFVTFKHSVIAAMTGAAQTQPEPVAAPPIPPKLPLPDFEKQKLPLSNTNAGPHNAKVDQIKALAEKGDVAAILSLKFGTNTYAKKQVVMANDALAALGSQHKVALGQKASAHPALVGGLSQPSTPAAPAVAAAAAAQNAAPPPPKKPKPTIADLTEDKLPPIPDVMNWKGPGSPYSSKQWKNEANIAALNAVKAAALSGGMPAVDKLKFPQLNSETGEPTGNQIGIQEHPAKTLIGSYVSDLSNAINDFLSPPRPMSSFNAVSSASVKDAAAAFLGTKIGTTVASQPKHQQFGFWLSLGNVTNKAAIEPAEKRDLTDAEYKTGVAKYKKYSQLTKDWISHVQSSGQINRKIDEGAKTYAGLDLKEVTKAIYKDANEMPPGATLYRHFNVPTNMAKQIEGAPEGLVFQSIGGFCTSQSATATTGFGKDTLIIRAAPGAKIIHSHGSGSFAGEKELTTIPGQRYVLLGKKKKPNGAWQLEVLMLPPDEKFVE